MKLRRDIIARMKDGIKLKLVKTKKNTAVVEAIAAKKWVEETKEKIVKKLAKEVDIKGFRKGKAPLALVEEKLDPSKISEQIAQTLLPEIVHQAFHKFNFKMMASPRAALLGIEEGDWKFELKFPLLPEFDLGDYKKVIKDKLGGVKIWTPGDGEEKKGEDNADKKLQQLLELLLEKFKFEVPESLVEEEISRSLSRLVEQTERLGLKLEDYIKSTGKTVEQLRDEYRKAAEENLRIEVILNKIGHDLKAGASDEEIDQMIKSVGDEKTQKQLNTDEQRAYLASIISKRKTIDQLLKL